MKIAIAGYGVEGQQNYAYWAAQGDHDITIVDENEALEVPLPDGVETILGKGSLRRLDGFDMVVRSAGVAPYKIHTDGTVWSATNEFFKQCPAPIIGITGSKGKGTTASLVAAMLEAAGKKVWLVGNIGVPALSVLSDITPDHIVVYELSSFQLWDIQYAPHIAAVLHIEREHLNVHRSMEEYVTAKARITRQQTADDVLIYNRENQYARQIAEASNAQRVAYPSDERAHIKDEEFYYGEQRICPVGRLRLKGVHNQMNTLAAIDVARQFTQDAAAIEAGLQDFTGLPHRLSYVATVAGVEYYDDSIATTPSSAIAALRSFGDIPKVIILGGSSKGSEYTELAEELTRHTVHAILIGDEASTIATALEQVGGVSYETIDNAAMPAVVQRAAAAAQPGGVVLLSPAAASFGLFRDYSDRGDQFIAAVRELSKGEYAATD